MALVKPQLIKEPFAIRGDAELPSLAADDIYKATQPIGFPVSQSNRVSEDGRPVKRTEMNGVFQLYSSHILYMQCGGRYTFNQEVADEIGGYPLGARLYDVTTGADVVSMIDGNLNDFTTNRNFLSADNWDWYDPTPIGKIAYFAKIDNTNARGYLLCSSSQIYSKTTYARLWRYAQSNALITTDVTLYGTTYRGYFLDRQDDTFSPPNLCGAPDNVSWLLSPVGIITGDGETGRSYPSSVGGHTHTATTNVGGGNHDHSINDPGHVHNYQSASETNAGADGENNRRYFKTATTLNTSLSGTGIIINYSGALTNLVGSTTIANNNPDGLNMPNHIRYPIYIKY